VNSLDNDVVTESQKLVSRIKEKYPIFEGRSTSKEELIKLQDRFGIKLPDWYFNLYLNVPIIDAEFGFQEYEPEDDYDGISFVIWGDVESIIQECFQFEPGISMLKEGFIFVASCSHGSGDPIYINLNENQNDPGVYRIYHDDYEVVKVNSRLSEFFKQAVI
jgi:hypothetical protein